MGHGILRNILAVQLFTKWRQCKLYQAQKKHQIYAMGSISSFSNFPHLSIFDQSRRAVNIEKDPNGSSPNFGQSCIRFGSSINCYQLELPGGIVFITRRSSFKLPLTNSSIFFNSGFIYDSSNCLNKWKRKKSVMHKLTTKGGCLKVGQYYLSSHCLKTLPHLHFETLLLNYNQ